MYPETKKLSTRQPVNMDQSDLGFAKKIGEVAGTDLNACLTCMSCSGGCPMYTYMDYGPHGIMRLSVLGLKKEALSSSTIWRCVGCHSCAAVCPMAIDIAGVMDYLRGECLHEKVKPGDRPILEFHRAFLWSVRRHGRCHKVELMGHHKLLTLGSGPKAWFQDAYLGIRMILKGKLHLMPSRIMARGLSQVRKTVVGDWLHM
ncbi:MAG: 4Fe-4S dicluster domain-containing protein [Deltaproteobacteria bacterium]|jgi:heterodisulfide reductase subunit C|nr:4Fe-4S dicluster domain-containing protein [Deltaproteobacteria bacterium]